MFVEECGSMLKSLEVKLTGFNHYNKRSLRLPYLEHLDIELSRSYSDDVWPFDAATPLLLSYKEIQCPQTDSLVVLHTGTERVIHLQTDVVPQFERYPSLQCFHLSPTTRTLDSATFRDVDATARRLCKGFERTYFDDHMAKDAAFVYCRDEAGNLNLEVAQGCTFETPFEPELF